MLYHTAICVSDVERAARFYDPVLGTLGYRRFYDFSPAAVAFGKHRGEFWIQSPAHQRADEPSRGAHFAFAAPDRASVERFYAAALAAGGRGTSPPAAHPEYHAHYYGAVMADLDGHQVEVLVYRPRAEDLG
jgi:catechol 2,3-dioxygenase-like lactoylglutathione lyase family enzyme